MTARYAVRNSLRFFTSAARIFSGLSFYQLVHAAFRIPLFVLIMDSTMLSSKGCAISASNNARAASVSFSLGVQIYREGNKGLYVVEGNFFLLLLNCSAWPCLGPAQQNKQTFISPSVIYSKPSNIPTKRNQAQLTNKNMSWRLIELSNCSLEKNLEPFCPESGILIQLQYLVKR